jgi:hypothetical protein
MVNRNMTIMGTSDDLDLQYVEQSRMNSPLAFAFVCMVVVGVALAVGLVYLAPRLSLLALGSSHFTLASRSYSPRSSPWPVALRLALAPLLSPRSSQ